MRKIFSTITLIFFIVLHVSICCAGNGRGGNLDNFNDFLCEYYSQTFGYEVKEIHNPTLYDLVDHWLGTPYKYSGNYEKGIDCSGFSKTVYASVFNIMLDGSSADLFNQCKRVKKSALQEGDLVFFKIGRRRISHVGIYLGQNKFAHASTKSGVTISDLNEKYYCRYFFAGGRVK